MFKIKGIIKEEVAYKKVTFAVCIVPLYFISHIRIIVCDTIDSLDECKTVKQALDSKTGP